MFFSKIFKFFKSTTPTEINTTPVVASTKPSSGQIEKRRKRREYLAQRQERHKILWSIIRLFVEFDALSKVDNIYDFKKSWERLNFHKTFLASQRITDDDIEVSYRVIRKKCIQGDCDVYINDLPELTKLDIVEISNTNKESILLGMYDRMKLYWDEVLASYMSKHAKRKRIEYLIERLSKEQTDTHICDCPPVITAIDTLIDHYKRM